MSTCRIQSLLVSLFDPPVRNAVEHEKCGDPHELPPGSTALIGRPLMFPAVEYDCPQAENPADNPGCDQEDAVGDLPQRKAPPLPPCLEMARIRGRETSPPLRRSIRWRDPSTS